MSRICLWRRLAARLIRLGAVRGVGRHESPQRLKNHGAPGAARGRTSLSQPAAAIAKVNR